MRVKKRKIYSNTNIARRLVTAAAPNKAYHCYIDELVTQIPSPLKITIAIFFVALPGLIQ